MAFPKHLLSILYREQKKEKKNDDFIHKEKRNTRIQLTYIENLFHKPRRKRLLHENK